MFDFGIKKGLSIKDIMLDEVDDRWYLTKEYLDEYKFLEEPTNGVVGQAGYIMYNVIKGNGKSKGRHQDNKVYDSNRLSPTVEARVRPIIRVIIPPREGKGIVKYRGEYKSIRWLSPLECWRLQGLKDEYYFRAEKALDKYYAKLFERSGRAICIPMLKEIFNDFFKNEDTSNIKMFEAFSGIGSQRIASLELGLNFESVGTMEVDKYGILAYDAIHNYENPIDFSEGMSDTEMVEEMRKCNIAYNFSDNSDEMPRKHEDIVNLYNAHKRSKNFGDITKCNIEELPNFDFFTYSFPCKNISLAGHGNGFEKGSGTQSSLVWECERIIEAKRPKYLMLENVKNIIGKENLSNFNEWISLLSELGYKSQWKVYNACDYGVPQNRERVIMMSKLLS